jgi:hypothetical protein
VVMNPPFAAGDLHLLKAWDWLYKGEIVCLLNAETLRNPYTETRKRLVKIIAENNGRVKELGRCFSTAERATDVDVVQVYLKKEAPSDEFDLWATEASSSENNPGDEADPDQTFVAIRDNLANIVRWYEMANQHFIKGFQELRRGMLYLKQNKISDYSGQDKANYSQLAGQALDNSHSARADFLRKHRRDAWTSIFHQMQFSKWLDSKQQEQMMRDVSRDLNIPFTVENIRGTLENVFLSRKKLFDQSVANVFDDLCSHAIENCSGPECPTKVYERQRSGWKTNDTYKVNERLVFPYAVECWKETGTFHLKFGTADRILTDLDRIVCVLDAQPFEACFTVGAALQRAFSGRYSGNDCESQYFEIRYYKKGTVHLKWKRKDLLEAFNKTAAAGKKWLGGDTSFKKAVWRERPDYYCEHQGHEYVDGVCSRCERPEVDPLSSIQCEYCRMVAEFTGREECPIHQAPAIAEATTQLALPSPSAPEVAEQIDDQENEEHSPQAESGVAAVAASSSDHHQYGLFC